MGKISIHLNNIIRIGSQKVLEAGNVRAAQPKLTRPVNDVHLTRVLKRQFLGNGTGAIRAVVIYDQQREIR